MADTKITDLPQDAAPTNDDYIVMVDVNTGATKKVLRSSFFLAPPFSKADNPITPPMMGVVPAARLLRTTSQSIPTGVETLVTWDDEDYDTLSLHSTSSNTGRITVPAGYGGLWRFSAMLSYASGSGSAVERFLVVYKNGAVWRYFNRGPSIAAATIVAAAAAWDMELSPTDYVEIYALQSTTNAMNVAGGDAGDSSFFNGHFVGALS